MVIVCIPINIDSNDVRGTCANNYILFVSYSKLFLVVKPLLQIHVLLSHNHKNHK